MVRIGMPVQIIKPYKKGEIRNVPIRTRKGKVLKVYKNFVLVRMRAGYNECFKEYELISESEEI